MYVLCISIPYVFDVWDCSVQKIIGRTTWMTNNLAKRTNHTVRKTNNGSTASGEHNISNISRTMFRLLRQLKDLPQSNAGIEKKPENLTGHPLNL